MSSVTLTSDGAAATAPSRLALRHRGQRRGRQRAWTTTTISYVDGSLTVTPRPLTITANDETKTYGDTLTFAGTEFTTSGLVNGDSVDSVTLTSDGARRRRGLRLALRHRGQRRGRQGLANYDISYLDGSLTVDQALTITANDATKTYGDTLTFGGHRVHDQRPGQRRQRRPA